MTPIEKTISITMLLAVGACADSDGSESVGVVGQAVLNGRPSGTSENLTVFVTTTTESDQLRCSGTLIAPNIVMTARHCVLVQRAGNLVCTSDGHLVDQSDPRNYDLRTEEVSRVAVRYGADASEFETAHATQIFTPSAEVSICRNDVALIVLDRRLVEHYPALRMNPVALRQRFSFSGWGYSADHQTDLPGVRSTLDDLMVKEVGPGLIPPGQFATSGNTLCHGDSGGAAWIDGAVAGVYSRIEGSLCANPDGRSVFVMLASQRAFIESTFAAVGATPWIAGEPAPWLTKDGAACTSNEQCQSALCTSGICGPPAAAPAAPPETAVKPGNPQGCAVTTSRLPERTFPPIFAGFGLAYVVRGRKFSKLMQTSLARTVGRVLRSLIGA